MSHYESAKQRYASIGVDTDAAIEQLKKVSISMHCWQGDDVRGLNYQAEFRPQVIIQAVLKHQMN